MDNNSPKYKLTGNAKLEHVKHDAKDVLVSFDIVNPPSKKQPAGSLLHFDLSDYLREGENVDSTRLLREKIYQTAHFLAENVPAFTALSASVAESGAQRFVLKNPDATRFGIAAFPGVTTIEKVDVNKPVVMVGNLDRLTEFSQIGYERYPKVYLDSNGNKQDLRPAIVLFNQLAMASKDIQQWPLPLTFNGRDFGREETIHNVMKAGFFVRDAINLKADDLPTLDKLRLGHTPDKFLAKGYPDPNAVLSTDTKQNKLNHHSEQMKAELSEAFVLDRILQVLARQDNWPDQLGLDRQNSNDLAM